MSTKTSENRRISTEYRTVLSILGTEALQWNVISGMKVLCVQNFTELYRTLLTFVASRSNVARFCSVLKESEIQQLEHTTDISVWRIKTVQTLTFIVHVVRTPVCNTHLLCGVISGTSILNDSFNYNKPASFFNGVQRSLRLKILNLLRDIWHGHLYGRSAGRTASTQTRTHTQRTT